MSEELDYMSEEFIKECAGGVNDVRPGLLRTHKDQREHQLVKKKKLESENKKKPVGVLQAEVLEESLRQPIASTNKGFSMLEKMGFKSGMGLGKNNMGIKEPIGINIKNDKVGLGHKSSYKQVKPQKQKESELERLNENEYRAFLSKKNKQRETLSDFRKSQRVCKEFDLKFDKTAPEESWFWPDEAESELNPEGSEGGNHSCDEEEEEEEEMELSVAEKLELLTKYLRENYFYCIWCRVQYEDEKDLKDCPGVTRDDH